MKKKISIAAAVLAIAVSLAGPAAAPALARSAKKDLTVTLYEKRIQDLSSAGLTLNFVFKVANSSTSPWYMNGYDYRVVIENSEYFSVRNPLGPAITVAPSSATLIALPIKVTNANLFKAVPAAEGKDKLSCYLIGGINFGEVPNSEGDRLPVACSGEFPIYRDVEILFRPLEVKDLTIGGGDLAFKAVLSNGNAFSLRVASLRYTLEVGGVRVSEGALPNLAGLEARGTKEFALPLLLDFFELGNSLYVLLQKPSVPCRFSATVEIETDWGRFSVPLEKAENIPVTPVH